MTTVRFNGILKISIKKLKLRNYHSSSVCYADDSKHGGSPSNNYYDIVVSGMGMVGSAFACALGQDEIFRNLKIAVIESSEEKKEFSLPIIHSNRVSALNQNSVDMLKSNKY
jgi:hypothetical protein